MRARQASREPTIRRSLGNNQESLYQNLGVFFVKMLVETFSDFFFQKFVAPWVLILSK